VSWWSEYGQFGFSSYNNFYGGNYWTKVLKVQEWKKAPATLWNIMNAWTQTLWTFHDPTTWQTKSADFTPYLVVPTWKAEKYLQVAEANKELQWIDYA
jgi:RecB family exonuclease